MTALTKYQRLESPGIWHETPDAQRRDVFVCLGEATLVITDKADTALTHWSLPAVVRISPGNEPAIFAPGTDESERLELTDPDMIDALDQVRRALARGEPQRGRLRWAMLGATLTVVLALGVFWLPGALVKHTARALPEASRAEIGRRLILALGPYTGRVCRNGAARPAMEALTKRLFGEAHWELRVVQTGPRVLSLPGGLLLIGGDLLESRETPDATAGHLLAAAERSTVEDPMEWMLEQAGVASTFRLLTSGRIDDAVLDRVAQSLALGRDLTEVDPDHMLARFAAAGVSSRPYGMTADADGDAWIEMIEGDPFPDGTPDALLTDAQWLRLQSICD